MVVMTSHLAVLMWSPYKSSFCRIIITFLLISNAVQKIYLGEFRKGGKFVSRDVERMDKNAHGVEVLDIYRNILKNK